MFLYHDTRRFFASVAPGIEDVAARELESLGAEDVSSAHRGVHFVVDPARLPSLVYQTRLVSRVLAPLQAFACHSAKYLHRRAMEMPWEELLTPAQTLAVSATVSNSRMRHSQYAALTLKDAVCDRLRERTGERPDVDREQPHLRLHVHLQGNKATVSVDCGDGALHRRGYRRAAGEAPLQETLAAAILAHSGWDASTPLYDPMCGSGTLLAEAFMQASRIPAGFLRPRFGFETLPDFDAAAWKEERRSLDAQRLDDCPVDITGGDIDAVVLQAAKENLGALPAGRSVGLSCQDFQDHPGLRDGTIVCNPPYGLRLGDRGEAQALVKALGDFLKQRCAGSSAWIYLGDRELLKHVGLRPRRRIPLRNGGLDGRLAHYELY